MASYPQQKLMTDILNLTGFIVRDYRFISEVGIILSLENQQPEVICPECGSLTNKVHQNHPSTIRDISWGEQQVYLRINRRNMRCDCCGKKWREELSFVKKNRNHTKRFTQQIVQEVIESDIKNVGQRHDVSQQEIETMLRDMGEELIEKKPSKITRLGIDEIAIIKGQGNYYVVLTDLERGIIVGLIENRTESTVTNYLQSWGQEVLSQIKEVSIDLWKPYKKVAEKLMPQAIIVADRFHVMKQVNKELDDQRKNSRKEAKQLENKSEKEQTLAGLNKSKYALLKNEKDLTEKQKNKLEEVKKVDETLVIMHQFKEDFRDIFEQNNNWVDGLLSLADWLKDTHEHFPESSGTIRRWLGEILAYFDNRTTQGVVEGINNKLKLIKRRGYGFSNFDNFSLRCFLTWLVPIHFAS